MSYIYAQNKIWHHELKLGSGRGSSSWDAQVGIRKGNMGLQVAASTHERMKGGNSNMEMHVATQIQPTASEKGGSNLHLPWQS